MITNNKPFQFFLKYLCCIIPINVFVGILESTILLDTDVRRDVFSSPQKPRDFSKTGMFNVHNAHCKSRDHGESLRHRQILWSSGMQFSGEWEMYNGHCKLYTVHPIFLFHYRNWSESISLCFTFLLEA